MSVIDEIAAERERQKAAEGWTPEHDDTHIDGQMATAAACYAIAGHPYGAEVVHEFWPWNAEWLKPKDRRRDLVRAAALIVAEIERMDRAAMQGGEATCGSNVAADAWVNSQTTSLAAKLPTLPAGTSELGLTCFMRHIDGSLLDLSQLCNATADHPVLAQMSVKNSVKEQSGMRRQSLVFRFK